MGKESDLQGRLTGMLTQRYGAGGLHLFGHIAAFAIAAYTLAQIIDAGHVVNFVAWFGGAAVLHDVVFLPVYSVLDWLAARHAHTTRGRVGVPIINHVRVPALISGLLLLVYFPLILGTAAPTYLEASGHRPEGYARNWALITTALFAASAIIYALRGVRHRRR